MVKPGDTVYSLFLVDYDDSTLIGIYHNKRAAFKAMLHHKYTYCVHMREDVLLYGKGKGYSTRLIDDLCRQVPGKYHIRKEVVQ